MVANLTSNTLIHESAVIGAGVELGEGVTVGPHAVLLGPCVIGDGVWIGGGASIGAPPEISSLPQNTAWKGDLQHAGIIVGAGTVIREGAVVHQGSLHPTTIGPNSWILNRAYIAHDVSIGEHSIISAGVSVGGHCWIGEAVNIGMNASIHQRRVIGAGAMIGMGTPLTRDVPPFAKVFGSPPRFHGLNAASLSRFGIGLEARSSLSNAYMSEEHHYPLHGISDDTVKALLEDWLDQAPAKPLQTSAGDRHPEGT